jgi:hypothetical protein
MESDNQVQRSASLYYNAGLMLLMAIVILMVPLPLVTAPPVALRASIARVQNTDPQHPQPASFEINFQETPYSLIINGSSILVNSTKPFFSHPDHTPEFPVDANHVLMALVVKLQKDGQLRFPAHFCPMRVKPNKASYKQVHPQGGARYVRQVGVFLTTHIGHF